MTGLSQDRPPVPFGLVGVARPSLPRSNGSDARSDCASDGAHEARSTRRRLPVDRFDERLRSGLSRGLSLNQIGRACNADPSLLRERAKALGQIDIADANALRRRLENFANPARHLGKGDVSYGRSIALTGRRDDATSRLIRSLRYHVTQATAPFDIGNVVACLHTRGVTLDEMDRLFGIKPVEAVAAIRAHCAPIGGAA